MLRLRWEEGKFKKRVEDVVNKRDQTYTKFFGHDARNYYGSIENTSVSMLKKEMLDKEEPEIRDAVILVLRGIAQERARTLIDMGVKEGIEDKESRALHEANAYYYKNLSRV